MWRAPQPPLRLSKATSRVNPDLTPARAITPPRSSVRAHLTARPGALLHTKNAAFAILILPIISRSRRWRLGVGHAHSFTSSTRRLSTFLPRPSASSDFSRESPACARICSLNRRERNIQSRKTNDYRWAFSISAAGEQALG